MSVLSSKVLSWILQREFIGDGHTVIHTSGLLHFFSMRTHFDRGPNTLYGLWARRLLASGAAHGATRRRSRLLKAALSTFDSGFQAASRVSPARRAGKETLWLARRSHMLVGRRRSLAGDRVGIAGMHDEHGASRGSSDGFGLRTKERSIESAAPAHAHDNEIGVAGVSRGEHDVVRSAFLHLGAHRAELV